MRRRGTPRAGANGKCIQAAIKDVRHSHGKMTLFLMIQETIDECDSSINKALENCLDQGTKRGTNIECTEEVPRVDFEGINQSCEVNVNNDEPITFFRRQNMLRAPQTLKNVHKDIYLKMKLIQLYNPIN